MCGKLLRGFLVGCCAALLLGCSPEYNWRQVAVADGRLVALFPAKPVSEQRSLAFEALQLPFSMTQARVDKDLFVVGYAPWGPGFEDAGLRERVGREVLLSLYRNFGAVPPETLPIMGEAFELRGGPESSMRVQGRLWLTAHGLVEGLVMAQDAGQAKVFFEALAKGVGDRQP